MDLMEAFQAEQVKRDILAEGLMEYEDKGLTMPKKDFLRQKIAEEVEKCENCPLCHNDYHLNKVPGTGSTYAKLMLIGEGPGEDENKEGEPFVGKAGQLLNRLLAKKKIKREDIYISNVIKCRPPNNRNPKQEEMDCCSPFILAEIELIQPTSIILLGSVALNFFCPGEKITKNVGVERFIKNIYTVPTFHPAFLLRQTGDHYKKAAWQMWDDFEKALQYIENHNK